MLSIPERRCVLCGEIYRGLGHNAQPLDQGRCCNQCSRLVDQRRIKDMQAEPHAQPKWRRGFDTPEHYPQED